MEPLPDTLADVDDATLERWQATCCDWLARPYPYVMPARLGSPDDLRLPSEQHPAFGTGYDWHSAVHFHWSLVRLLAQAPELPSAERARAQLADTLQPARLRAEAAYLHTNPLFERPYGWAWGLVLAAEIRRRPVPDVDPEALGPLVETVAGLLAPYLGDLPFPERGGLHRNTAFALLLIRHAAPVLDLPDLARLADDTARRLFAPDVEAPVAYEPGPADFLSPTLIEAHLMAEVLGTPDAAAWLAGFLPDLMEGRLPDRLATPVGTAGVEGDALAAHLRGLNLSRAWNLGGIAAVLPPDTAAPLLDARRRHLRAALPDVVSGDAGSDHWLVSFALLAFGALG